MDNPWQLCRTIGPLLSQRFPLASAKAQPRVGFQSAVSLEPLTDFDALTFGWKLLLSTLCSDPIGGTPDPYSCFLRTTLRISCPLLSLLKQISFVDAPLWNWKWAHLLFFLTSGYCKSRLGWTNINPRESDTIGSGGEGCPGPSKNWVWQDSCICNTCHTKNTSL